jgi:hypothetical protein
MRFNKKSFELPASMKFSSWMIDNRLCFGLALAASLSFANLNVFAADEKETYTVPVVVEHRSVDVAPPAPKKNIAPVKPAKPVKKPAVKKPAVKNTPVKSPVKTSAHSSSSSTLKKKQRKTHKAT